MQQTFSMWMHGVDTVAASATAGHKEQATPDSMQSPHVHVPRGTALAAPHVHSMLTYAAAPRLAHILMAADVLIDDTTQNSVAAQLAVLLQQPGVTALLSGEGKECRPCSSHDSGNATARVFMYSASALSCDCLRVV
eukprot:jgi/Ulvmu1/2139/UM128_0009.1